MPELDVVELLLLVDVDEHSPLDRLEQTGALHLERLEDDIAVGQDHRRAESADVLERIERAREEPVRERIIDEVGRDRKQVRLARMLHAVALESAEVVGISELSAELLEYLPVLLLPPLTDFPGEVKFQVRSDPVVVDQRVVDVEE